MFNKKLTVLMPVYNGAKYINKAIDSLLNQSYDEDYDILIIDDGSTDNTVEIVRRYTSKKIHLLQNEKNLKVAATLNRGLDLIKGEYILRMDADDISHMDRLKILVDFMDKNKDINICASLVSEDEALFNKKSNVWNKAAGIDSIFLYTPDVLRSILPFVFVLNHSSVILRNKMFLEKKYRYSTEVGYIEDYDLWLRLLYKENFYILPKKLLAYRKHEGKVSRAKIEERYIMLEKIFTNFFNEYGIRFDKSRLQSFCKLRAKVMHNISLTESEKDEFFDFIKQVFYTETILARHSNPDYLHYVLKRI